MPDVRADRLLSIMLLLRDRDLVTVAELAGRLEVSERTVLRDMEALSTAGVPVYAVRGRHGGFGLLEGFRADVGGLDDVEAQALFAYLGLDTFGDLGLSREVRSALDKLTATAPARLEEPAARLREVVHVDRRRWFAEPDDVTHLPVLRSAAVARRRVRIGYRSPREATVRNRTLDPLGLVENGSRWYLVAYRRGEPRTFRLGRITRVEVLDQPARLPPEAGLQQVWQQLRADFERTSDTTLAHLALHPVLEEELRRAVLPGLASGAQVRLLARSADRLEAEVPFRLRRAALGICLAFGGAVEVLGPADLREEVAAAARGALAAHATSNNSGAPTDPSVLG